MLFVLCAIVGCPGCGNVPARLGVLVNDANVSKSRIASDQVEGSDQDRDVASAPRRFVTANLRNGDDPQRIAELPRGEGVEIRDSAGHLLQTVRTSEYLTDFGTVPSSDSGRQLLVLYTYPNASRGGTFQVRDGDLKQVASWAEYPPPGAFTVGKWHDSPALFYLQSDTLVVRSPLGRALEHLHVAGADIFRRVFVQNLDDNRTAILATGSGYTPFHMVCLYDRERMLFQEVLSGRAYDLVPQQRASEFVVKAADGVWKYTIG
jgi:hypothetical protein